MGGCGLRKLEAVLEVSRTRRWLGRTVQQNHSNTTQGQERAEKRIANLEKARAWLREHGGWEEGAQRRRRRVGAPGGGVWRTRNGRDFG